MEKNNILSTFLIIAIVIVGGYYLYQKMPDLFSLSFLSKSNDGYSEWVALTGKNCSSGDIVAFDGVFDKIEGDWLYFYPRIISNESKTINKTIKVKINEETAFHEVIFDPGSESDITQENIALSEIKNGDIITIAAYCGDGSVDNRVAAEIRVFSQ